MATTKEIKSRMNSVSETQKITNAMYLIASTKLRKAKSAFLKNSPYFEALRHEIKRIFRTKDHINSIYFDENEGKKKDGANAYLIITADKGLAGAYNQNIIKRAMTLLQRHRDNLIFVVGEYGRHYFSSHHIPIEQSFLHTAQNPTLHRAREICEILLEGYKSGQFNQLYVIYTDYKNGAEEQVVSTRLLPFRHQHFSTGKNEKISKDTFEFYPSAEAVLEHIMPHYLVGFIYSVLVDSFCSEQYARMTAMDSANTNAQNLLADLSVEYHHVRQSAITQEITEISSGAKKIKSMGLGK